MTQSSVVSIVDKLSEKPANGHSESVAHEAGYWPRVFTKENVHPFDEIEWKLVDACIKDINGNVKFEQKSIEVPAWWDQNSINIVADKYMRYINGRKEFSVKQIFTRVASVLRNWANEQSYFNSEKDAEIFEQELIYALLHQYGAFNSPVWFNLGVPGRKQAASACFISSVEDSLDSIMEFQKAEAKIFAAGSGSGANLSNLRSSYEKLSSGSYVSGPLAWMRGLDQYALAMKSGGSCLAAYQKVYTSNGPISVRDLAESGEKFIAFSYDPPAGRYKAKWAKAWYAGKKHVVRIITDKGKFDLSYDHPVKLSTHKYVPAGKLKWGHSLFACTINEHAGYLRLNLRNGTKGKEKIHRIIANDILKWNIIGMNVHHRDGNTHNNSLENLELLTDSDHHCMELVKDGHIFQSNDHPFYRDSNFWKDPIRSQKCRDSKKKPLVESELAKFMQNRQASFKMLETAFEVLNSGYKIDTFDNYIYGRKRVLGRITSIAQLRNKIDRRFGNYENFVKEVSVYNHQVISVENIGEIDVYDVEVECPTLDDKSPQSGHNFVIWSDDNLTGSGIVVSNTRMAAKMVVLDIDHPDILETKDGRPGFIRCKAVEEKRAHDLILKAGYPNAFDDPNGAYKNVQYQNANHSVSIPDDFMHAVINDADWQTLERKTGKIVQSYRARDIWDEIAESAWMCADPGIQFSTTINKWHTTPNNGPIRSSNPCCFRGNTLIMTDSGPVSIADICHNFSSKSYYVICLDDNKRVRIRKVIQAKSSGFTNQLIKITTHTGAQFECTPNHKWITETGWVPAESLKPGTKLIGIHSFHSESIGFEAVESILIAAVDFIQCDSIEVFDIEVDGVHNFVITDGSDLGPVVHNSEFLHVDNTACNLCAINLTKFFNDDKFDFERFSQSIRLFVTAQNAIIDKADYPTQAIGDGSHKLRPIGLNYGDLGALIMDRGYSYDSDEGRAIAARMASLMTGLAYLTSAKLASRVGAFSDFEKNRDEMLHVMWMHQHADSNILKCWNLEEDPIGSDVVLKSSEIWSEVIYYGEKYGYTISQASVQAPLGCLVAGSFVSTDQGMIRIEDIGDPNGAQWQDINLQVHTDDGPQKATKFYVNGVDDIIEVITENGYVLRGTPKHQIKIVDSDGNWIWRRFDRLEPGDTVPLAMKQHVGSIYSVRLPPCPAPYWAVNGRGVKTPEVLDTRLAELIGMFSANGSVHHKGLKFAIDPSDKDVIEKYASFLRDLFGIDPTVQKSECVNLCLNSTQIRSWWDAAGFSKICLDDGKLIARIPDAILRSNNPEIYGAYLRGLFTGDGSASNGLPSITNKNYEFLSDIQVLLLFLGIPTRRDFNLGGNDKKPVWRLTVSSLLFSSVFLEKVGFSSSRKSNKIHVAETWSKADYIPIGQTLLDKVCPIESDHRKDFVRHIQENNGVARHLCFKIVRNAELSKLLDFYYDKIKSTELIGRQSTYDISVPGNTTYIANGFISHNTVSFLMGMNTTGIEPAYSLVSYKSLVGGGFMKITNQNVKNGLKSLGYSGHKISSICKYIEDHDCIEGSPDLKPEHLPVFDCAMPSGHSSRHLSPMAHIKMMAAIQPLITCAMSKTINIPNSASINEIADLYMESWKLGLKCVSVYRDGCKLSQPLATKSRVNEQNGAREERKSDPGSQRRRLPEDISGHRHQFEIDGFKGYIMTNEYPDGLPGEVFIRLGKPGSTVNGLIDGFTKLLSIALQYGVPLEKLIQSFIDTRFEPAGITKNSKIRFAKSIYDYLFRYLDYRYNKSEISQNPELKAEPESDPQISISKNHNSIHPISRKNFDGPPCVHCGAITRRNGSCWLCDVCGNTTGGCS